MGPASTLLSGRDRAQEDWNRRSQERFDVYRAEGVVEAVYGVISDVWGRTVRPANALPDKCGNPLHGCPIVPWARDTVLARLEVLESRQSDELRNS